MEPVTGSTVWFTDVFLRGLSVTEEHTLSGLDTLCLIKPCLGFVDIYSLVSLNGVTTVNVSCWFVAGLTDTELAVLNATFISHLLLHCQKSTRCADAQWQLVQFRLRPQQGLGHNGRNKTQPLKGTTAVLRFQISHTLSISSSCN